MKLVEDYDEVKKKVKDVKIQRNTYKECKEQ